MADHRRLLFMADTNIGFDFPFNERRSQVQANLMVIE